MPPISIYIHWPFCLSLCPYCDFNSHISGSIDHEQWLTAYKAEIDYFAHKISGRKVRSIFFGGGTPSLMKASVVEAIIQKIGDLAKITDDTEITLEANPTSYETQKFEEFKSAGVNRVSIGVQSLRQEGLQLLGRKHSAKEAMHAIESASKLFARYSFDLIYAIPDQTLEEWQDDLKAAMSLAGGHISLYQLTIEKGTPFYKLFHDGKLHLPSNDISSNMYEWTNEYLLENGYRRYEISNYAKQTHESIHNLCYWNYNEYIGIGAGAHSRLHNDNMEIQAIMMTHAPAKWLSSVMKNGHGIQTSCNLSRSEVIDEMLLMGTRLETGILEDNFQRVTGMNFESVLNLKTVKHYIEQDLVSLDNGRLKLTDRGLMLHNYLVPRMIKT
ncbi:MAG: coproporphyrinogen III oxidase [Rickettsiales bacterium]|nr:MAG: coproporphyrinogen III oxidase [Rickettsiales bacterium]